MYYPPPSPRGLRPGEGAQREVAAFLLDHDRFAGVPATALVEMLLQKADERTGEVITEVGGGGFFLFFSL